MKEGIERKVEFLVHNNDVMKKKFIWHLAFNKRLSALLYSIDEKNINHLEIESIIRLIKNNTSTFSMFQGNTILPLATMLSLKENQEELLSKTVAIYDAMKSIGYWSSDFLVIAAFLIADNASESNYSKVIARAKKFYELMKEKHKFITGADDYIFTVLLALSNVDLMSGSEKVEEIYLKLKTDFKYMKSTHSLAKLIVIGSEYADINEIIDKIYIIRNELRLKNLKIDKDFTLTSLGILSLLPIDPVELAKEVSETYTLIRNQKGFGKLSGSDQEVLILASSIVSGYYLEKTKRETKSGTPSAETINLLIAAATAAAATTATARTMGTS